MVEGAFFKMVVFTGGNHQLLNVFAVGLVPKAVPHGQFGAAVPVATSSNRLPTLRTLADDALFRALPLLLTLFHLRQSLVNTGALVTMYTVPNVCELMRVQLVFGFLKLGRHVVKGRNVAVKTY